jgi:MFS transporter, DHA1 family, multidrug resistance protein
MALHPEKAGTASALVGILQWAIAAVTATAMGATNNATALPMTGLMAASSIAALLLYRLLVTRPVLVTAAP